MPDIEQLIAHFDDDSDDQRQLIALIARIVEPTFRRALARWHAPIQDLEDLRQDFFLARVRHKWRALKNFSGSTEAELAGYWQEIARHFSDGWLDQRVKHQRRESDAIAAHIPHYGSGTTEAEIRATLEEIEPALSESDRQLLNALLASPSILTGGPSVPAESTLETRDSPEHHRSRSHHAWLTRISRFWKRLRELIRGESD